MRIVIREIGEIRLSHCSRSRRGAVVNKQTDKQNQKLDTTQGIKSKVTYTYHHDMTMNMSIAKHI